MKYNHLYASFFKKIRVEKQLKLEAVASMTNYSVAYLSELERGKKKISTIQWNALYKVLIENTFEDIYIEESVSFITKYYLIIFNGDEDKYENIYNWLLEVEDEYSNSPLFIPFNNLKFIYYVMIDDQHEAEKSLNYLNKYIKHFSSKELYYHKVYLIDYYFMTSSNKKAIKICNELLESSLNVPKCTALLYYFYSHVLIATGNFLESYHYAKLAQDEFFKDNNLVRYASALQIEANINSEFKNFGIANSIYSKIFMLINKKSHPQQYFLYKANYSYSLLMQKRYEDLLLIDIVKDEEVNYHPPLIMIKSLCLYHTNKDECIAYIKSLDYSKIDFEFIKAYVEIILLLIEQPNSVELEKKLSLTYKKHQAELDNNVKEFLLNHLLTYYRENNNKNKQIKTLEELLKLRI